MTILDDPESIATLDSQRVLWTIGHLTDQIDQAWREAKQVVIPKEFRDIQNITFCGMGGSALGPHIICSLYQPETKRPMLIVRDYHLGPYVNKKSLVVLCSYSGNTEELLSCGQEALQLGAQIVGVASGGKLPEFLKKNQLPCYHFKPTYNTSEPRYGTGYMTFGPLALLHQLKLLRVKDDQVTNLLKWLSQKNKNLISEISQEKNVAKKTALETRGKVVVLVGAEFLEGATHVFANQFNETGKNFATLFTIPELNHHLLEGVKFPNTNPENLIFLFINSPLYSKPIQKRFEITKDIIRQHQVEVLEFIPSGQTKLNQAFEVIQFGSYVTFYLAMLNAVDPSPNPWVDYFKKKLAS